MEKRVNVWVVIIVILMIALVFFASWKFTGYVVEALRKQVRFYFYDELTNCSLDGYVSIGKKIIGKTNQGYFNLTLANYEENFNNKSNISLFGRLDNCFDTDLFFDKYWKAFEIERHYFLGDSVFNFKTKINPHNPAKRELIGFIQPDKVAIELENIDIRNEEVLEDLSEINNYLNNKINYTKDWDFNKENYWQTPLETLELKQGDCEDYSTALLSLFLAYNHSLNCYNVIFASHVTTFCYIDDYYLYYDQGKTELKKRIVNKDIETKPRLATLKQEYFKHYGINNSERAYYVFNENKFIEFKDDNEFIEWQSDISNKKQEFDLFENLEQKLTNLSEINETEELELRTQAPSTELPTLGGFFTDNTITLSILGIIFIILFMILIKIIINK